MNQFQYQSMPPPPTWGPVLPSNPPLSSTFWTGINVKERLKELHDTLNLAKAMQKELEMLMRIKEAKLPVGNGDNGSVDTSVVEFAKVFDDIRVDLGAQESMAVEAATGLMSKLRSLLEPFRVVTDEMSPWEEKSAAVRLAEKVKKSKRNKQWRKKKRKQVAQKLAKERKQFEQLDREADEWRAREIAKDIAQQKMEKMKEIAKQKAKEERKRLEAELELALIVEKLQELRSMRIQKLKKQGHFFPEEDDEFMERVRAAVEEEERQAKAAADTDAARDAIAAAEESRKVAHADNSGPKEEVRKDDVEENQNQKTERGRTMGSDSVSRKECGNQGPERPSHGTFDYVASLPPEFYRYYHGSNTDMGTLIEVRRTWDAYIKPGGSRIPGHLVPPPPPANEIWASYLVQRK